MFFLLSLISCGRGKLAPDELKRDQFFAEILKRESCRCLGNDRFFEENLLANPYPEVRQWCAITLGRIADPQALPWLYAALRKGDSTVRAASAFAIGEIEDRQFLEEQFLSLDSRATSELVRLLDDTSLFVKMRAVEALGKTGSHAESEEIVKRLERVSYRELPAERAYLDLSITALTRIKDPMAFSVLEKLAGMRDPEIQWRALNALILLRDKAARSIFIALLESGNPVVRSYAARGIGITENPSLAFSLLALLPPRQNGTGDPIPLSVRFCALQALGDLKNPAAIPAIRAALAADPIDDAHPDQQNFAIQAASTLGDIGASEGESVLLPLLRIPGPIANQAVVALAKILKGNPDRFLGLTDNSQFTSIPAMRAWAEAMAELGGPDAVEELNRILVQTTEHVTSQSELLSEVLNSLAKIGPPELQEILQPFLNSHDATLLRAAVAAYKAKPGSKAPWIPVVQAFTACATSSDVEARIAILNRLKPWIREKNVQEILRSGLKDHERSIRLISAGLLRSSGVSDIAYDSGFVNRSLSDAFCIALAASRKNSTIAIIETTRGTMEIELFREDAPVTVANFVLLANRGSYNGLEFGQVVPFSRIEAGDSRAHAGSSSAVSSEINMRPLERGSVGMPLAGRDSDVSRFFIALTPQPDLDGLNTCFGRIVSGMQVADRIVPGDRIKQIMIKETKSLLDHYQY